MSYAVLFSVVCFCVGTEGMQSPPTAVFLHLVTVLVSSRSAAGVLEKCFESGLGYFW